ncbi:hypothetical protein BDR06DRAFT_891867 [Suillus hirtellus]|nr:hypothetical protein BDR06DRAFT_891867 [Suillus hirtellus]
MNQRTVHTIITLKSKESANQILCFDTTIKGKKVFGCKLLPELTQCLKCQFYDRSHVTAECTQEHNMCGTCGTQHRTATCKVDDPHFYHCANCDCQGHTSWSRDCPAFINKWESFKNQNKDSRY